MADVKISGLPASTVPLGGTEVLPIVQGGVTKQVSIANVTAGRSVAALSIVTPTIQAEAGSAGGTIKNGSGVAQLQWGSGGASNLSLEVATNINPANAAVSISPTGTGTVAISPAGALTINPTAASTINNTSIGATTASTGRFTSVTATTGNVVIGTSGQGIDFSATSSGTGTMTSELFSDYEEGTFTADFVDSVIGSVGTVTGVYTKIGRMVCVTVYQGSNFPSSTPSGTLTVTGLPFTSLSNSATYDGFFIARKVSAGTAYRAYLGVSSTTVTIRQGSSETGENTATLLYTNGGTSERAGFSLTYFA
jgi:hypothetical protein